MQGGRKYITKIDAAGIDTDKMTIARSIANYSKVRIPIVFESGYRHKEEFPQSGKSTVGFAENAEKPAIIVSEMSNSQIPAKITGYLVEIDLNYISQDSIEKAISSGYKVKL